MRTLWKILGIFILVIGLVFLVIFLSKEEDMLYKHGEITPFKMESVFSEEDYVLNNDKVKIVVFFYTSCPDICPLTMNHIAELQEDLKEAKLLGTYVEIISISFDPEVDTIKTIKNYAQNFQADSSGWHWLRETDMSKLKEITKEFQMIYKKSDEGFITHSTTMYVLDDSNSIRDIYNMATPKKPVSTNQIMEDILQLID